MSAFSFRSRPWLAVCALVTLVACGSGENSPEDSTGGGGDAGASIDRTNPASPGGASGTGTGGHAGHDLAPESDDGGPCGPLTTSPIVIADHQAAPGYLAVDDSFLYWAQPNIESRTTWRAPKDGSGAPTLLASNLGIHGVAADGSYVYWGNYSDGVQTDDGGSILRAPRAGGPYEPIATKQPRPSDIIADGGDLFWIASGTLKASHTDGRILRWSDGMGEPQVLAEQHELVKHLVVSGDSVFWVDDVAALSGDERPSTLFRVDRHGGEPEALATSDSFVALAVDADAVYWSNQDGIWRLSRSGGTLERISDRNTWALSAQASGECIYFASRYTGISRIAKHGGKLSILAADGDVANITVEADAVYASYNVGRTDGRVVRIPLH